MRSLCCLQCRCVPPSRYNACLYAVGRRQLPAIDPILACRGSGSTSVSWTKSFAAPEGGAAVNVKDVAVFPGGAFVLASVMWRVSNGAGGAASSWLAAVGTVWCRSAGPGPRGLPVTLAMLPSSKCHVTCRALSPPGSPTLGQTAKRSRGFGATMLQQIPGRNFSQTPSPPRACKTRPASLGLLPPAPLRRGLCGEVRDRQFSQAAEPDRAASTLGPSGPTCAGGSNPELAGGWAGWAGQPLACLPCTVHASSPGTCCRSPPNIAYARHFPCRHGAAPSGPWPAACPSHGDCRWAHHLLGRQPLDGHSAGRA